MPKRNETIATNEVYYVRPEGSTKVYRVFSPEQMRELIESGRVTDKDFVGIQRSPEGLGGGRGTKKEGVKRIPFSSENPWSYAS